MAARQACTLRYKRSLRRTREVGAAERQADEQLPELVIALHLHKLHRLRPHAEHHLQTGMTCC